MKDLIRFNGSQYHTQTVGKEEVPGGIPLEQQMLHKTVMVQHSGF